MVMVLGLLYGSLWAIRLFAQQGRWAREGADLVRLRTTIRLGNNQMLHVVQFGSQLLLVGSSQMGLALLGKMPASPPAPPSPDFGQTLTEALEREED
jgi:flagellar biogenesis protein FliO